MYVSAVLSLCCCPQAFSSCSKQGPLFVEVHGLLTAVASLAVDYRLQAHRLSAGGSWAPSAGSAAVRPGLRVVAPGLRVRAQQRCLPGSELWLPGSECGLSSCGAGAWLPQGMWVLPWTRDQTCVSCIGRWILPHWSTREASVSLFLAGID